MVSESAHVKRESPLGVCRAWLGDKHDDFDPPSLSNRDQFTAQYAVRQTA